MNNRLTVVFVFVSAMVFAQRSAIALTYGTHLYSNSFVGQVNTLDSFQIGRPVQYIGLSANGYILFSRKVSLDGHLIMAKYLPQQINLNDSTDAKLSGSSFGFAFGFDCLRKAQNIDFILGAGLNFGRMKITQASHSITDEKVNLSVKNMFISPKASAMLILYLKSISLSFNAEYGYDISASGWKRKIFGRQESSLDLPSYNQSGLGFSVALGCAF